LFFVFAPVRFGFDLGQARALLKFGLPLAGSSIIVFAVSNADQLVVGHLLGATALGFYALALNLASWPVTMFSLPTRSVAPAVFSRLQHDRAAMRAGFLCVARLLSVIAVPICLVLGGAAIPLVGLVYGPRWVPAAAALAGLGVLSALRIGFELIYDFFVVLARSRVVLVVQLVWLAGLIPGLIGGTLADGISGAAIAEAAVAGCLVLPCYLFWLAQVGIKLADLASRLWLPIVVGVAVAAVAAVAAHRLPGSITALEVAAAGTLAGVGFLATRMRPTLTELRQTLQPIQVLAKPGPQPPGASHESTRLPARDRHRRVPAERGGDRRRGPRPRPRDADREPARPAGREDQATRPAARPAR
jgi:PST family polysaccharide transporter